MARGEKPYRVYRSGRGLGLRRPRAQPAGDRLLRRDGDGRAPGGVVRARRRERAWTWKQWVLLVVAVVLVVLLAWGALSYLAFRKGVRAANARLDPAVAAVLDPQDGLLLSHPTTVLLLGTDHANTDARVGARRSDSIMLVRTDPGKHRISYLSIPRDLKVDIPGHGEQKINAAFQIGGPALAVRTIQRFTGLEVNHAAIIDFDHFRELIDALGGVDVDVPAPILSNSFDCPFKSQARCQRWPGWRFRKGKQHMDGKRALIYARIRENRLNPAETDLTRGERQQRVLQAVAAKLTSPSTLAKLPSVGDDLLRPLATDLTAWQFLQLGWVKFRAPSGRALHCRLGGSATDIGGQAFIVSTEENFAVIRMFTGQSAAQPPPPGSGPFGPGCVLGSRGLG